MTADLLNELHIEQEVQSLIDKGLVEEVTQKDGTIAYQMTLDGYKIAARMRHEQDTRYFQDVMGTVERATSKVRSDIEHHFDKFGAQRLDLANWWMVLGEESGEAIQAANNRDWAQAKKEVMQTIACWIRFLNEVEREERGISDEERPRYERAK